MSKKNGGGTASASIAVGRTRTGKTTFSKAVLDKIIECDPYREIIIYDVNNEFGEYYDAPFVEFEAFMELISTKKNCFIHIEEATIFFTSRSTDRTLINKLVRKRHENNIISLNFHSWGQLPKVILDLVDYVHVFKTNDSLATLKAKTDRPKILAAFNQVQKSENSFDRLTVDLYG